jgi:uncharacterized Fe-S cluster-containing protein
MKMKNNEITLPSLDCGLCGFRTCNELNERLPGEPGLLKRCIHIAAGTTDEKNATPAGRVDDRIDPHAKLEYRDSLGRDFDFYLEHFPEDPGPREIIIPHNPMLTRELDVQVGDTLIGRPLGMSCGCPVTHCGIAIDVDKRTGVIVWCVTGPLTPRQKGYKDLGYYIAEGYEGLVKNTNAELRIGCRYYFQPRMCMLQWRHSGLINFLNKTGDGWQVRLEGLWIG